jgi:prepilin-type N-terminal cleavage/methylation domain-containing protein
MIEDPRRRASRRRGFTLIELMVTLVIIAIAISLTVEVIGWVAAERRSLDRRHCALQEAVNLMERLTARPFEQLTADSVRDAVLSQDVAGSLPHGELTVSVRDENTPVNSKQVRVQIRWQSRTGQWQAPVRLTSWVYRKEARP